MKKLVLLMFASLILAACASFGPVPPCTLGQAQPPCDSSSGAEGPG